VPPTAWTRVFFICPTLKAGRLSVRKVRVDRAGPARVTIAFFTVFFPADFFPLVFFRADFFAGDFFAADFLLVAFFFMFQESFL
jgi:hypothetical protein